MIGIIVLARPGSRRLPLKHLIPIGPDDENTFEIMAKRWRRLAIPVTLALPAHCPVYEEWGRRVGWKVFTGGRMAEGDVFRRAVAAARRDGYNPVVVVNGDSPCVGPMLISELIDTWNHDGKQVMTIGPVGLHPFVTTVDELWAAPFQNQLGLRPAVSVVVGRNNVRLALDERRDIKRLRRLFREVGLHGTETEFIEKAHALGYHPDVRPAFALQHPDFHIPPGA